MLEQIEARQGARPAEALIDGGYVKGTQLDTAAEKGVTTYAPVKAKNKQPPDFTAQPNDSPAVAAWRERMGTDEAKAIYKERCETAELVNAVVKTRFGLDHFPVRGLHKVLSVSLWMALTYNVLRFISLTSA